MGRGTPEPYTHHRSMTLVMLLFLCAAAGSGCSMRPLKFWKQSEKGIASWYGNEYHGRTTASGERFDENQLTAAHRTLPFGSVVRVKNLKNGQTVKVRINDRGPFVRGRIIDVSKRAAHELGMLRDGVVPCRVEVLHWGG